MMPEGPASTSGGMGGAARVADERHIPVLLDEVLEALGPKDGERYVDATFGAGGYTRAILDAADCRVHAVDRDPTAVTAGFPLTLKYMPRLQLSLARFSIFNDWADRTDEARAAGDTETGAGLEYDGFVFDLGVSSMQIDEAERGFSFMADGPLDMRMSANESDLTTGTGPSAADLVNTADEADIADILYHYGEERRSRAIARAIVAEREKAPFKRTLQLADLVERVLGRNPRDPKHPATRTFQALRIAVNRELDEIVRGLAGAERLLKPGGRLVVVTFHSLEDRIVKRFLAERSGKVGGASRHLPEKVELHSASFRLVNQRPLTPGKDETERNPRARSAKLRAAIRLDAPARPLDAGVLGLPPVRLD